MILLKLVFFATALRFARSERASSRHFPVRPPSFRRTPTLVECRDGTSRPLVNASVSDFSVLRSIHPHCPSSVLEFRETLPHCPDVSFCPREFRAVSPCGDCCFVCRVPNEDFMAENAAANGGSSSHNNKIATSDPCHNIKCKRHQKCVLNIQGLPVCRCFPVQMCSTQASIGLPAAMGGKKRKDKRLEKVCGNDGVSYETKCHMQVAACQANLHIRIAHKGACIKPAERDPSHRAEPSLKVKPSRGNRKQNRQSHNNKNAGSNSRQPHRHYPSTPTPSANTAFTIGRVVPHQPPAIIVPIISPPSSQGGGGRKQQGVSWSRPSVPGPAVGAASTTYNRDRAGGKGRKTGRRDKNPSRSDRQRSERPRGVERLGGRAKSERTERVKQQQQQQNHERMERTRNERPERTRNSDRNADRTRPKTSRTERPERPTRIGGRPDKPKATKKIQRLERKKHKLEKRLLKEKEKVRRKLS